MKIRELKLYPITTPRDTGVQNQHVIVRLETEDGCVGWGEMSDLSHLPMYQFDIPELEKTLQALVAGQDPRNFLQLEDDLIRYYPDEGHKYSRSGLVREGVTLALLDLVGRADNKPVYELLGGKRRDKVKVCFPIFAMRSVNEVAGNLERVQAKYEEGFDLIRVYVGINADADEQFLGQFADRFGGRVAIKSLDFSNALDWRRAWQATERYSKLVDFMLVESVAPYNDLEGMIEYRRRSQVPVSEHVQHLQHGWLLLSRGCVDILNVSPYLLGGLHACLRMIALAEAARASVLIGTTQELNLGTAGIAHLGAAARVLDFPSDSTGPRLYTRDVVREPVRYEAGYLHLPEGAGLGVEVDEQRVLEMTSDAHWTFGVNLTSVIYRTPPVSVGENGTAGKQP